MGGGARDSYIQRRDKGPVLLLKRWRRHYNLWFEDGFGFSVSLAGLAVGGEQAKVFLKSRCTFTNHSGQVFKPAGTLGRMSADGAEGEPVFQEGFSTPDNPVLPGKSVTWWMGQGVESVTDVQLTVALGFLDHTDITFN